MNPETGFARVDGGRLWYEVAGEGAPVVLLHGGLWDSRMWDDQFEALAERCRAVRYDLRGYGRSDRPAKAYSHSDDLKALLDQLKIERAALVGLSMGAMVAVDFTLEHPDRVEALVLAAPGLGGFEWSEDLDRRYEPVEAALKGGDVERAAELELAIWARKSKKEDPRDLRMREIAKENAHQVTLDPAHRRRLDPPAAGRLGEIKVPTLVISGDKDLPDVKKIAALLLADIPEARRAVMQGADHVVNMRRPADFTARLLGFLDQVF
ncbi:MAG: alpha/beta fold hydrolase [Actinomycetota bacterium]